MFIPKRNSSAADFSDPRDLHLPGESFSREQRWINFPGTLFRIEPQGVTSFEFSGMAAKERTAAPGETLSDHFSEFVSASGERVFVDVTNGAVLREVNSATGEEQILELLFEPHSSSEFYFPESFSFTFDPSLISSGRNSTQRWVLVGSGAAALSLGSALLYHQLRSDSTAATELPPTEISQPAHTHAPESSPHETERPAPQVQENIPPAPTPAVTLPTPADPLDELVAPPLPTESSPPIVLSPSSEQKERESSVTEPEVPPLTIPSLPEEKPIVTSPDPLPDATPVESSPAPTPSLLSTDDAPLDPSTYVWSTEQAAEIVPLVSSDAHSSPYQFEGGPEVLSPSCESSRIPRIIAHPPVPANQFEFEGEEVLQESSRARIVTPHCR